jgi:hypothetical protein
MALLAGIAAMVIEPHNQVGKLTRVRQRGIKLTGSRWHGVLHVGG